MKLIKDYEKGFLINTDYIYLIVKNWCNKFGLKNLRGIYKKYCNKIKKYYYDDVDIREIVGIDRINKIRTRINWYIIKHILKERRIYDDNITCYYKKYDNDRDIHRYTNVTVYPDLLNTGRLGEYAPFVHYIFLNYGYQRPSFYFISKTSNIVYSIFKDDLEFDSYIEKCNSIEDAIIEYSYYKDYRVYDKLI